MSSVFEILRLLRFKAAVGTMLFAAVGAGYGDEIVLRNGRKIEGIVETNGDEYIVRDGTAAAMRIPKHEVLRVEKKLTLEQRYENLRMVTAADKIDEQLNLAKWCRQNNLASQARRHFARAMELDPTNYEARRGAGYQLYKGEWKSREEVQRAEGKELYKGEWLPKETVEKKLAADALAVARERTRGEVNDILRFVNKLQPGEDNREFCRKLAAVNGPNIQFLLGFAAGDSNPIVRDTVYRALAERNDTEGLAVLLKRFRSEEHPRLLRTLTAILCAWKPSAAVSPPMFDMALHGSSKKIRQRAWPVLRADGNKQVIDALINAVDFCPVPEEEQKRPDKTKADGLSSSNDVRPRKPYYPAHQLLMHLTNQKFAFDQKEQWQQWWEKHKETFDFQHPPQTEETVKKTVSDIPGKKRGDEKENKRNEQKK